MPPHDEEELRQQVMKLRSGIREIAHDISNPLGVLRMAVYYLEHGKPDREKIEHYYGIIGQTVEKMEAGLVRLRALSEIAGNGFPPEGPAEQSPGESPK